MNHEKPRDTEKSAGEKAFRIEPLPHAMDVVKVVEWYTRKAQEYARTPGARTAWATAGFPIELLWTFDVFPHHPENKAVEAALYKQSLKMIEHAEGMGYSRDLCSYCKTSIGAFATGLDPATGGIVKPDMAVCTSTICDTHWKWFQFQAERLGLPYFLFDVPHEVSGTDQATKEAYIDYLLDQMHEFFSFMEQQTGNAFDDDKFLRIIEKSDRLSALWHEIFSYRRLIPTPYSLIEALLGLFPLVVLNGLDPGIEFYEKILADVKERAEQHRGVLPAVQEKYRIIWEGIPFWHRTKFYYELARYGAVVAFEPYTISFAPRKTLGLSVEDTLRELASIMMDLPYSLNLARRIEYFKDIIREYSIDGVILHENVSCRPSSTGMVDLKNTIRQECGVPVLILRGDQADPRAYSDAQVKVRVEAFIELMENNGTRRTA